MCVVRGPCPYWIVVLRKPEPHPSCSTEAIWRSREKGQTYLRPRVTFDDFEIEAKSTVECLRAAMKCPYIRCQKRMLAIIYSQREPQPFEQRGVLFEKQTSAETDIRISGSNN
jgi:hypothetical protein